MCDSCLNLYPPSQRNITHSKCVQCCLRKKTYIAVQTLCSLEEEKKLNIGFTEITLIQNMPNSHWRFSSCLLVIWWLDSRAMQLICPLGKELLRWLLKSAAQVKRDCHIFMSKLLNQFIFFFHCAAPLHACVIWCKKKKGWSHIILKRGAFCLLYFNSLRTVYSVPKAFTVLIVCPK